MEHDFKIFDQNIDFSRSKFQRSDFHAFQVDWILFDDSCKRSKIANPPSIWMSEKAVFISKTKYHSLLLARLTLGIYEVFRIRLINELKEKREMEISMDLILSYHDKATKFVNEMITESSYGNSISKLLKYNRLVGANLGIDNIKK
ncbi:MAG: hypothetical protein ACI86M_001808 [Saprospiraceae bacterium]|jgi:hypothetical protein